VCAPSYQVRQGTQDEAHKKRKETRRRRPRRARGGCVVQGEGMIVTPVPYHRDRYLAHLSPGPGGISSSTVLLYIHKAHYR
jgi:hypothetical protein